jgi:hypothetical protein
VVRNDVDPNAPVVAQVQGAPVVDRTN